VIVQGQIELLDSEDMAQVLAALGQS